MADDMLGYLGLDAKDFAREAKNSTAHAKYLEQEAIKLEGAIRILDRTMRASGTSTGRQVAQLGQLRVALKGVQADLKIATRDAAAFGAVNGGGGAGGRPGRGMGMMQGLAGLAGVSFTLLGVGVALRQLGRTAIETSDRINESRDKFMAGGSRLEARTGGIDATESSVIGSKVDDAIEKFKNKAGDLISKSMLGIAGIKDFLSNAVKGKIGISEEFKEKLATELDTGATLIKNRQEARDLEDEIAHLEAEGVVTADQKVTLMEKQRDLAATQQKIAANALIEDRKANNAAKAVVGSKMSEIRNDEIARRNELLGEVAKTQEIKLQQGGMKGIAEQVAIRAEFEPQIAKANREGKPDVAELLKERRDLKMDAAAVAEHNLTPGELREERGGARKFDRDVTKAYAQQKDLEKRLEQATRQGNRLTPGSRLARFAEGKEAEKRVAAIANQDMRVQVVNAATLNVTNFTIGGM